MWPRGILNRSEPRNNMVYVSYDFYLINLVSSLFRTIPACALHHSSQSSHYQGMTMMGTGPFSTLHDQHKRYHESRVMTWIGELLDLNLAEEMPFLSACWYFDNVFLLGHSGNKLIPSSHTHFCSIWEHLAQNHIMFSKFLLICFSGDDWGHSFKIIVNYEDDYLKHHM